jgi:predicted solute-binding protein
MKISFVATIGAACLLTACGQAKIAASSAITSAELESFFQHHTIDGHYAVALKKHSAAGNSYLATVHGYPNNFSVCQELIKPYNESARLSVIPGQYSCEELKQ